MSNDGEIVGCAIHPAIGIARIGNSTSGFFLGPQFPGDVLHPPHGCYKDEGGAILRQAAQFRVYGLDRHGRAVKELLHDPAAGVEIEWNVHLANRKAAWYQFINAMDLGVHAKEAQRRNGDVTGPARASLIIDGGKRTISGVNQPPQRFDQGEFMGERVYLGELRTGRFGRLRVLGGLGESGAVDDRPVTTFANNDGWHDDIADGPVGASVRIHGRALPVEPAFVVVAPPNFGQHLYPVVTLYDVVSELFFDPPADISFFRDIYPIFSRLVQCQWVNQGIYLLFGVNSPSDLTSSPLQEQLADPSEDSRPLRRKVFNWFRDPDAAGPQPVRLPPFYGDDREDGDVRGSLLSVTRTQYGLLRRWAEETFSNERRRPPKRLEQLAAPLQPDALDRAALEECVGGPFHPGIELPWIMRQKSLWQKGKKFRLKALPEGTDVRDDYGPKLTPEMCLAADGPLQSSGPGTLTRWMAVPWQTDAASCLSGYDVSTYLPLPSFWAVRVPNQVLSQTAYERLMRDEISLPQRLKHFDNRQFWMRDLGPKQQDRLSRMVTSWSDLGIVAPRDGPGDVPEIPGKVWVETERSHKFKKGDATLQQVRIAEDEIGPAKAAEEFEESRTAESLFPRDRDRGPGEM